MSSTSDDSDASSEFEDIPSSSDDGDDDNNMSNTVVTNEQWVKLIQYCSVKSKSDESVTRGIGVEQLCKPFDENKKEEKGWILKNNNQEESLIVSFETPVFINEIHIYESLNPGSILKLEMLESQQEKWWTMWQRKAPPEKQSVSFNIFKPLLRRYHNQSNTIRMTFDPRFTDQIGIQAIKLVGSNIFDTALHCKPLAQSLMTLYEQAINNINTDVQFSFDDKILSAHRNILCCRSSYFRSLLLNDFIEKTQTKPIQLTDIDSDTFLEMLYFIYTGTYHPKISFDTAKQLMIYANKINFITARNAAMEHICLHLRSDHNLVIDIYRLAKEMSPAFDLLLEYVYDFCSEYLNNICKQKDFIELDKELMIDLICQSAERREIREQEKTKQMNILQQNTTNNDEE